MKNIHAKTHTDGIWISQSKEVAVVQIITNAIQQQGFNIVQQDSNNYSYPYIFVRDGQSLHCRFVDSVFLSGLVEQTSIVITDNIPLQPAAGKLISVVPEFWHIWHFEPKYQERAPTWGYNCFMNRPRGDRSVVFYELIKRNMLTKGLVSFNLTDDEYQKQFVQADLTRYSREHNQASVPYNNLTGALEQCIIDSNVSLVLETYVSDSHAVFSEKIFRSLQMPRPWLLYCSPQSVGYLRNYGFDVLDDYIDHTYDNICDHHTRLNIILDQLDALIGKRYRDLDFERFARAAEHNQLLLSEFTQAWPSKLDQVLEQIKKI